MWSYYDQTDVTGTNLVGIFEGPTVDAIVGRVQGPFGKPGSITLLKATSRESREGPVPVQHLASDLLDTRSRVVISGNGVTTCLGLMLVSGVDRLCVHRWRGPHGVSLDRP